MRKPSLVQHTPFGTLNLSGEDQRDDVPAILWPRGRELHVRQLIRGQNRDRPARRPVDDRVEQPRLKPPMTRLSLGQRNRVNRDLKRL